MLSRRESLSANQLAMLLDEVAQMAKAQRPLAPAIGELNRRGMGRLGRVAGVISRRLTAGESAEQVISDHAGRLAGRTAAALGAVTRTGSIEPVFRLVRALRDRESVRVQAVVASVYPLVSMLVGYLLLSVVMTSVILESHASDVVTLRGEGAPASSALLVRFCEVWRSAFWVPPLVVALALWAWLMDGLWRRGEAVMPWLVRAANRQRWSEFCGSMGRELDAGSMLDQATETSAAVAGNHRFVEGVRRAADQLAACGDRRGGGDKTRNDHHSDFFPPLIAWMLGRQSGSGNGGVAMPATEMSAAELAEQWRMLAQWYRQEGLRLTRGWVELLPSLVGVVVGGGCILLYVLVVLAPMWRELARM